MKNSGLDLAALQRELNAKQQRTAPAQVANFNFQVGKRLADAEESFEWQAEFVDLIHPNAEPLPFERMTLSVIRLKMLQRLVKQEKSLRELGRNGLQDLIRRQLKTQPITVPSARIRPLSIKGDRKQIIALTFDDESIDIERRAISRKLSSFIGKSTGIIDDETPMIPIAIAPRTERIIMPSQQEIAALLPQEGITLTRSEFIDSIK